MTVTIETAAPADPAELVGEWTLHRRLVDRAAEMFGRVDGTLSITAGVGGLRWHEAGELHWGEKILPVTRDLILAQHDGRWWTTFTDGRLFHPWLLDTAVVHPCAADTYVGRLVLSEDGQLLRVAWDVTGPTKRQRIITRHRRR